VLFSPPKVITLCPISLLIINAVVLWGLLWLLIVSALGALELLSLLMIVITLRRWITITYGHANMFWKNDADLWLKRNNISTKIHHIRRDADMKT
jgi:hypothetical protein